MLKRLHIPKTWRRVWWRLALAALLLGLPVLLVFAPPVPTAQAAFGWYVGGQLPGIAYITSESCCSGSIDNPSAVVYHTVWGAASGTVIHTSGAIYIDLGGPTAINGFNYYITRTGGSGTFSVSLQWSNDAMNWSSNIFSDEFTGGQEWTPATPDENAHGMGITARYLLLTVYGPGVDAALRSIAISADFIQATPFATATEACIPAAPTGTPRAPTPFGPTLTPTGTLTPTATPSGTSTPGPTATPQQPSFDSGLATFNEVLSPWTTQPQVNTATTTRHSNAIGYDGSPGVAIAGPFTSFGFFGSITGSVSSINDGLIYSRAEGLPGPLRVTGYARSPELYQGENARMTVLYKVSNGWIFAGGNYGITLTTQYMQFNFVFDPGVTRTTAIALVAWTEDTLNGRLSAIHMDNVRIYGGSQQAISNSYPICEGTATTPQRQTKICLVRKFTVDVYGSCVRPTDVLDFGGWISYLWCVISKYFEFTPENRDQLSAMQDRQANIEPLGTLLEVSGALERIMQTLDDIAAIQDEQGGFLGLRYRFPGADEILTIWNAGSLDSLNLTNLPDPDPSELSGCTLPIANLPGGAYLSACYVTNLARGKFSIVMAVLQLVIDGGAIMWLVNYVQSNWMSRNG